MPGQTGDLSRTSIQSDATVQPQTSQANVQDDFQQIKQQVDQLAVGGKRGGLEVEPVLEARSGEAKSDIVAEVPAVPELEKKPELSGFVDKVDVDLDAPVVDDYTGQILLKPSQGQNATVVLPLTEEQVREGLHHRVFDAIRWLAEWCVRQIKMLHGRVRYKPSEAENQKV